MDGSLEGFVEAGSVAMDDQMAVAMEGLVAAGPVAMDDIAAGQAAAATNTHTGAAASRLCSVVEGSPSSGPLAAATMYFDLLLQGDTAQASCFLEESRLGDQHDVLLVAFVAALPALRTDDAVTLAWAIVCPRGLTREQWLDKLQASAGGPCGQQWGPGARAFRCKTCQKSSVTALCEDCFHRGGHAQHEYVVYESGCGGTCDCGVEDCLKPEGFCSLHRPQAAVAGQMPSELEPTRKLAVALIRFVLSNPKSEPGTAAAANVLFACATAAAALRVVIADAFLASEVPANAVGSVFRTLMSLAYDHDLLNLIVAVLLEPTFKAAAFDKFLDAYPVFVQGLLRLAKFQAQVDEVSHRHLRLSVQLFACPTLWDPTAAQRALTTLLDAARRMLDEAVVPMTAGLTHHVVLASHEVVLNDATWVISADFRDLLIASPHVVGHLLTESPTDLQAFLDLVQKLEFSDLRLRQLEQHVEYEDDWFNCLNLVSNMFVHPMIVIDRWLDSAEASLRDGATTALCSRAAKRLAELFDVYESEAAAHLLVEPSVTAQEFLWSTRDVYSMHLPLHRCVAVNAGRVVREQGLGALHQQLQEATGNYKQFFTRAMQQPLRLLATRSQSRCGLWVRNGRPVLEQMWYYAHTRDADHALHADLFMVQLAVMSIDPSVVLETMAKHFGVHHVLFADDLPQGEDASRFVALLEDMLLSIISVLTERMHLSPKPFATHLRSKIMSMLAIEPSTHSKIMKHLRPPSDAFQEGCELHEQLLDELAEYSQSTDGLSERQYKLRGEAWREFDPSQVALRTHSHRDLQAAIERYFQEAPASVQGSPPATTSPLQACPPFRMPTALPPPLGARLSFVLFSPGLHDVLFRVLRLSMASTATSPSSSRPFLISAALHLLRLCCCAPIAGRDDAGSRFAETPAGSVPQRGEGEVRHQSVLQSALDVQSTGETLLDCVLALVGKPDVFADQQYLLSIVSLFAKDPACAAVIRAAGIEPHAEHAPSQAAVDQKTKRKQKAQARKAALMARLHQQQKAFLAAHENVAGVARGRDGLRGGETQKNPPPGTATAAAGVSSSTVVPASTPATAVSGSEPSLECAICFHALPDAPAASREQRPVLIGLAQASRVSRVEQLFETSRTSSSSSSSGTTVFHTCGHWAHSKCISSYTKSLHSTTHPPQFKHRRVLGRREEFLCPICRRLSNCALPLLDRVLSSEMAQAMHSWSTTGCDPTSLLGVRHWADSFPTVTVQPLSEVARHAEPIWCPPLAWTDTAGQKALTQAEGRSPNLLGQVIPDDYGDSPRLATSLADDLHDLWEHPAAGSHAQQMLLQLIRWACVHGG